MLFFLPKLQLQRNLHTERCAFSYKMYGIIFINYLCTSLCLCSQKRYHILCEINIHSWKIPGYSISQSTPHGLGVTYTTWCITLSLKGDLSMIIKHSLTDELGVKHFDLLMDQVVVAELHQVCFVGMMIVTWALADAVMVRVKLGDDEENHQAWERPFLLKGVGSFLEVVLKTSGDSGI